MRNKLNKPPCVAARKETLTMSELEQLKNRSLDSPELDELVALSRFARDLHAEFEALQIECPGWLDDRTRELRREITMRSQDAMAARLRELKARRAALGTPEEKRQSLDKEIERLTAVVGAV
jgi:hypothetical protein